MAKVKFCAFDEGQALDVWAKVIFGGLAKVIFGGLAKAECWALGEGQFFGLLRKSSLGVWQKPGVGRLAKVKFRHFGEGTITLHSGNRKINRHPSFYGKSHRPQKIVLINIQKITLILYNDIA